MLRKLNLFMLRKLNLFHAALRFQECQSQEGKNPTNSHNLIESAILKPCF